MLKPNNKQRTRLYQFAGAARYIYNWTIDKEKEQYEKHLKDSKEKGFIKDDVLRKELTQMKKQKEYAWLNDVAACVTRQAVKDACNAFMNYFRKIAEYPVYKTRKDSVMSFYQDADKMHVTEDYVILTALSSSTKANKARFNKVKFAESGKIPIVDKYYNPRVKYEDGQWWFSVAIEAPDCKSEQKTDGIGIDLGIKDLAICSDGTVYGNINYTESFKQLEKKQKRIKRSIERKYEQNGRKTQNIIKEEEKLRKVNRKMCNIRHNYVHQVTSEIVKKQPAFICIEDLNVSGMMQNKNLAKDIKYETFYEFREQIQNKTKRCGIPVIIADRYYPSSKLCNKCGYKKQDLTLDERVYICPRCGYKNDRDLNAALNLRDYGKQHLL